MPMVSLPLTGGPLDGQTHLCMTNAAFYWVIPGGGQPPRLVANRAELPYAEIQSAVGLYTRNTVIRGRTRHDLLVWREL